jgi:hypothetical protein
VKCIEKSSVAFLAITRKMNSFETTINLIRFFSGVSPSLVHDQFIRPDESVTTLKKNQSVVVYPEVVHCDLILVISPWQSHSNERKRVTLRA